MKTRLIVRHCSRLCATTVYSTTIAENFPPFHVLGEIDENFPPCENNPPTYHTVESYRTCK